MTLIIVQVNTDIHMNITSNVEESDIADIAVLPVTFYEDRSSC